MASLRAPRLPAAAGPAVQAAAPIALPRPRGRVTVPERAGGREATAHDTVRRWYEDELGWPTAEGQPVRLRAGVLFDLLELPRDAGYSVLRRTRLTSPVAVAGDTVRLLVAAGSAEEIPELLDWLEWTGVPLDLTARGAGQWFTAPLPPVRTRNTAGSREAAVWLRPPRPGHPLDTTLPASGLRMDGSGGFRGVSRGGGSGAVDLVRLVAVAATECHRARLSRATRRTPTAGQPLAFSYSSRTLAGTRPRSFTS